MKTKEDWHRHLTDLGASLDPTVYAVQWARDPRCLQSGAGHRRVGAFAQLNVAVCQLWAAKPGRD